MVSIRIERYYGPTLRPFGNLSKPVKIIDEDYLDWIREQPCVVSGHTHVVAHHVQRKSQGRNDYLTVPLTHELHTELHKIGVETFEKKHAVDLAKAVTAKLVEYLYSLKL